MFFLVWHIQLINQALTNNLRQMKYSRTPSYIMTCILSMLMIIGTATNKVAAQQLDQESNTEPLGCSDSWLIQYENTSASTADAIMLLDSVYHWGFDTLTQQWATQAYEKTIDIQYDGNHKKTYERDQVWNGTEWENNRQKTYTNDQDGNQLTAETKNWNNGQWENQLLWTYTYDSNGNQTSSLRQLADGPTGWVNKWLWEYDFDGNSNKTLEQRKNWNTGTGQWENIYRRTWTYDSNDNVTYYLNEDGDGSNWVNQTEETSAYDVNGNQVLRYLREWDGSAWADDERETWSYNGNGDLLTYVFETANTVSWDTIYDFTYTYDSNGNKLSEIEWYAFGGTDHYTTYTYDGNGSMVESIFRWWNSGTSSWVVSSRTTNTYDGNGNLDNSLSESWDENSQSWINIEQSAYTYDGNNNLLSRLKQSWDGAEWVNTNLNSYSYDSSDSLILDLTQEWDGNVWENDTRYEYAYDGYGNQVLQKWEVWNNNQWWADNFGTGYHRVYQYDGNGNELNVHNYQWDVANSGWVNGSNQSHSYDANDFLLSEAEINYEYETGLSIDEGDSTYYYFNVLTTDIPAAEKVELRVYPNPSSGQFGLITASPLSNSSYQILDNLGRLVKTGRIVGNRTSINMQPSAEGIYMLRLMAGNELLGVQRVVLMK